MRKILLFGAGKSSAALINYLLRHAAAQHWQLTVADANLAAIQEKMGRSAHGQAVALNIVEEEERSRLVAAADLVISLLPPALHILVAKDCLLHRKNLLTASYVDEQIRELENDVNKAGLLFLCEMGLDPGIDHMSAKKLIDGIQHDGGKINSFLSHCGGLVAPESDDNPWHYKISWNPRNVVMAGKAGARFLEGGHVVQLTHPELFETKRFVGLPGHDMLCWYPNRDSLGYRETYGLDNAATFIRTTLRHPDFIYGWKNLVDLRLTDENASYETDGKTLKQFFQEHMEKHGFGNWLEQKLRGQFDVTRNLLAELADLTDLEEKAAAKGAEPVEEIMLVDEDGSLQEIDLDRLKLTAAATLADQMHDAALTLKQLFYLGMDDAKTMINRGRCSAADVLQLALEQKLPLLPQDKDRVVMLHEIEYKKGRDNYRTTGLLVLDGDDARHTAMARTVGLPLAIAAKLILDGTLKCTGLRIPTAKEIYEPVLKELAVEGIGFQEETRRLS